MTHLEKRKKHPDHRCTVNTMEESLALLYREFGMTVTHGTGLWYMDLTRDTFRDPQIVDAVGRMRKWAEVALRHDRAHHSEVVVISQPQSGFYTGQGGKFVGTVTQQLYVKQMGAFYRAGCFVGWHSGGYVMDCLRRRHEQADPVRRERGEGRGDRFVRVRRLPDAVPFAVDLQQHDVLGLVEREREARSVDARETAGGERRELSVLGADRAQAFRRDRELRAV